MSLLGLSNLNTRYATPRNEYLQTQIESRKILNQEANEQRQADRVGDALSVLSDLSGVGLFDDQGQFDFKLSTAQVNDLFKNPVGRNAINTLVNVHSANGLIDGIAVDGSVTRNNFDGFSLAPPNEDGSPRLGPGGQPVYVANVKEDKPGALSKIFSVFGTPNDDDPAVTFTADKLTNLVNSGIGIARATGRGLNASDNFQSNVQLIDKLVGMETPLNAEDINRAILSEVMGETLTGNSPEENAAKRDAVLNIISNPETTAEELEAAAISLGASPELIKRLQNVIISGEPEQKIDSTESETPTAELPEGKEVTDPNAEALTEAPSVSTIDARLDAMSDNALGVSAIRGRIKNLRASKAAIEARIEKGKDDPSYDPTAAQSRLDSVNAELEELAMSAEDFLEDRIQTLESRRTGRGNNPSANENQSKLLNKARASLESIKTPSKASDEQQTVVNDVTSVLTDIRGDLEKEANALFDKMDRNDAANAAQILRAYGVPTREDLMRLDIPTKEAKYVAAAFAKYGERKSNQTPQELYRETLNFIMYGDAAKTAMDRANQRIDAAGKVNTSQSNNRAARQDAFELNEGTAAEQSKFQELQGKIATLLSNPDTFTDPDNTTKGENLAASLTGHIRELNALFQSSPAASRVGTRFNKLVSDSLTAAETNRVIYQLAYGGSDGIKEWFRDVWRTKSPGGDWVQNPSSLFIMSADGKRVGVRNTETEKGPKAAEVYEGTMTVGKFRQLMPQTGPQILERLEKQARYR